jgi:tetratricopeptide (TPR) repeat protein
MRHVVLVFLIGGALIGCTTLDDVRQAREFSIKKGVPVSNYGFYYDAAIGAYRERVKVGPERPGLLLKNAAGQRIQTEQELVRAVDVSSKESPGNQPSPVTVWVSGLYGLGLFGAAVYYWPVTVGLPIVHGVLYLPFSPVPPHLMTQYERAAEQDYVAGRGHFDAGEFGAALEEWERARVVMPSIQATSDINYWRGRAFEALHQPREAFEAYDLFLNGSTDAAPQYFTHRYADDPPWDDKAAETARRITALVAQGTGTLPDPPLGKTAASSPLVSPP